jgi:putative ABC transport system ATP-binding protein
LDSTTGQKILDIIFEEQERRLLSLLLVTHDAKVAERCDRVLHMVDGNMQESAPGQASGEAPKADSPAKTE